MTELPHVQRAHLLLLNGQINEWHETNKMWKKDAAFWDCDITCARRLGAVTVAFARSVTDLRYYTSRLVSLYHCYANDL